MRNCPNCNTELFEDAKFCQSCGKEIFDDTACEEYGENTPAVQSSSKSPTLCFRFFDSCKEKVKAFNPSAIKNFFSKKAIKITLSATALVLVAAIVFSIFVSNKNKINYALYIKDGELYHSGLTKISPTEVTKDLFADENTEKIIGSSTLSLSNYIFMSEDGEKLFFVDKLRTGGKGINLYYKKTGNLDGDAIKLDSNITTYTVNQKANLVTYLKNEGGKLYQHNLKKKEKLDENVKSFFASQDGKKVIYLTDENKLYLKYRGKEKQREGKNISAINYVSRDLKTIYYTSEDALYKKVEGKKAKKIDDNISSPLQIYASGEFYYLKKENNGVHLNDLIEYDLSAAYSTIKPEEPNYPDYYDYDSSEEWHNAYLELYNKFQQELDTYYEAEKYRELREEIDLEEKLPLYSLYFFDGKKTKLINDGIIYDSLSVSSYSVSSESTPAVVLKAFNTSKIKKINFSEIYDTSGNNVSGIKQKLQNELNEAAKSIFVKKTKQIEIKQEDASHFNFSKDGKTLYFFADISDDGRTGNIYKASIGSTLKTPKLYEKTACVNGSFLTGNNQLAYFKKVNDEGSSGTLYINKKKIDKNVNLFWLSPIKNTDKLIYFVDRDTTEGTLKMFSGSKSVTISEYVYTYQIASNGQILYLYDYSTSNAEGMLYAYNGKKSVKIDEEVSATVPIYKTSYQLSIY